MKISVDFLDEVIMDFVITKKMPVDGMLDWVPADERGIIYYLEGWMPSKYYKGRPTSMLATDWFYAAALDFSLRKSDEWKCNGDYTPRSMWREFITLNT